MLLLDGLAEFIANVSFKNLPSETIEQAKLHIFDSLGATRVGADTEEARANLDLIRKMNPSVLRRHPSDGNGRY
jgi:2-methylcitrate dehydratase PrpD